MFFDSTEDLKDGEILLRLKGTREARPERQWLPAYYFNICLQDGTRVGNCELRIGHNEKTRVDGNIGYGIYPLFRGHHYAAKACALLFRLAERHGMDCLLIACDPANRASVRTCELAGGKYEGLVALPEDHSLYADGRRQAALYRFDLLRSL